jgi:hypothetical protein
MDTLRTLDPLREEWVTAVFLLVLLLIAWVHRASPRKWRLVAGGLVRMRLGRQVLRDEIDVQDRTLLAMVLAALVLIAMGVWQGLGALMSTVSVSFVGVFVAVLGVYLAHLLTTALVRTLFQGDAGLAEHRASGTLLVVATGLAMGPLTVCVAYLPASRPYLYPAMGGLLLLSLLFRWVRAAWIGRSEGASAGSIILYLCAAEVMPVLLVLQAIAHQAQSSPQP